MPDDKVKIALEAFELVSEAEEENRKDALDDLLFARLSQQWPEDIKNERTNERRPCLTINRLPSFIRQVVNDGRQNKPSIKTSPVDGQADPDTAEILNGLIKNIEYISNADVAYDTALESSASMGWGYWRVNMDYCDDDSFDMDLVIERVSNPFSIYGDEMSTRADSSDWKKAFVVERMKMTEFERKYKGADKIDWIDSDYGNMPMPWLEDKAILLAEFWEVDEIKRPIVQLSDGTVMDAKQYKEQKELLDLAGYTVTGDRDSKTNRVRQHIMSGCEILETKDWAGKYIPIVPVYGEEINVEGKRYFRSLIRDAKDPQRMFNYWRTMSTELVALAPKAPFVAEEGSTEVDPNWATANTKNHPVLKYKRGTQMPQRQPFAGVPAGALQEAMNSSDDMKSIMGIFDASLGDRSNEVSGVAIDARDRQGETSTFHFIDNRNRAIRHTGLILLDLIPKIYKPGRIARILGGDNHDEPKNIPLGKPVQKPDGTTKIYDFGLGKYDLVVESGPSFTTQRKETLAYLQELLRAFPQAAPVIGDIYAQNLDIIGGKTLAKRLKGLLPPGMDDENQDPQLIQAQQQIKQLSAQLQALSVDKRNEDRKLMIDAYGKETDRLKVTMPAMTPEAIAPIVMQALQQILNSPDVLPGQQPAQQAARPQQQPQPMQGS